MWTISLQDRELTCWEEVRSWGAGLGLGRGREMRGMEGQDRERQGVRDAGPGWEVRGSRGWSWGAAEIRGWVAQGLGWARVEAALLPLPKLSHALGLTLALPVGLPGPHNQVQQQLPGD